MDYAPPNAADYLPDVLVSPKLWPRSTLGWSIAYNSALVKNPPKSWMDLTKPEYKQQADRPGDRAVRRHHLDARHVRAPGAGRGLLEEAGGDRGRCSIRPARRCPMRWCAARSRSRPSLYNIVFTKKRDGAPVEIFFPPEGVPINPYAAGVTPDRDEPQRRQAVPELVPVREGQTFMIKELGNLTSLKIPPVLAKGFDPNMVKVWVPNFEQYEKLRAAWIEEWNKTYGYRQ